MLLRTLAAITLTGTSLIACTESHTVAPKIVVDRQIETGSLYVSLVRGPADTFGDVTATMNGDNVGALVVDGDPMAHDANARTTFQWPLVEANGDALDVAITEDGDTFHVNVPTFGAKRDVALATALDQPLRAGAWIEASSGVATDALAGGFTIDNPAGLTCTVPFVTEATATGLRFQLARDLREGWWCGGASAGDVVTATLSVDLLPSPPIGTCEGPEGVTCEPIDLTALHVERAVEVQL